MGSAFFSDGEKHNLLDEKISFSYSRSSYKYVYFIFLISAVVLCLFYFSSSSTVQEPEEIPYIPAVQNITSNEKTIVYENLTTSIGKEIFELCSVYSDECPRAFRGYEGKMRFGYAIAPKYGLAGCLIPKSMSTLMMGVLCYLLDSEAFIKANQSISLQVWDRTRFCRDMNEIHSHEEFHSRVPNGRKFVVVRDPLSRFVSGFVDKCINEGARCYGCRSNLTCFVQEQYQSLIDLSRKAGRAKDPYAHHHFSPQNWRCDMQNDLYNLTIFKYGGSGEENDRMVQELSEFLYSHGVPEHEIADVAAALSGGHTVHTTRGSSDADRVKEKILSDRDLLLKIIKMYYYDYVLFGFMFPPIPSS